MSTELTAEFWQAAEHGQLVRPVCAACEASFFVPQLLCPSCRSADWAYQASSGSGAVYSYTVIHRPPDPSFEAPFVVADVQMDEGWRMLSWIVDCDIDQVTIGMAVQVQFVDRPDGRRLPGFAPA